MRQALYVITLLALLLGSQAAVGATSCEPMAAAELHDKASAVFWGEVTGSDPTLDGGTYYHFRVERYLKGSGPELASIYIWSGPGRALEGDPDFDPGERWLVLARESDGRWVTGPCTGTTPLAELSAASLATARLDDLVPYLGEPGSGVQPSGADGTETTPTGQPLTAGGAAIILGLVGAALVTTLYQKRRQA